MDDRIRIYKGYAKSMKFLKVQSFFLCVLKNFYGKSQYGLFLEKLHLYAI